MTYRKESTNKSISGRRLLTTTELFQKRSRLRAEVNELKARAANARHVASAMDEDVANLELRIAKVGVRIQERRED